MSGLRTAVGFLTRIPVWRLERRSAAPAPPPFAAALPWFPVVGLLVGAAVGGVRLLADLGLPAGPATALALAAGILLTGGLHEDGLADTADGLGAHVSRERRLEILRDSRIGTYGALALGLSLLLAWSLLAGLDGLDCLRAAIVAHVLGRWAVLPQARFLPAARADGSGALAARGAVSTGGLLVASAVAVAAALLAAGPAPGGAACLAAVAVCAAAGAAAVRALGGTTGDTYGATTKLVELTTYVVLVAAWGA